MDKKPQTGLGKGLNALIPKKKLPELTGDFSGQIEIEQIKLNKYQPREEFKPEKLKELVDSIKQKGVIEPIIVAKVKKGYQLVCGERRLRASKMLGLSRIPAIVKENITDQEILQISLIENIQREDLNVVEQAKGLKKLTDEFNLSQQEVANLIGKQRSSVSHLLRLLTLPLEIQKELIKENLSFGHAKVLLEIENKDSQRDICQRIIRYALSVRETERLIKKATRHTLTGTGMPHATRRKQKTEDTQIKEIEQGLEEFLGSRVKILLRKKGGKVEIEFYSVKDLQRILELIQSPSQG